MGVDYLPEWKCEKIQNNEALPGNVVENLPDWKCEKNRNNEALPGNVVKALPEWRCEKNQNKEALPGELMNTNGTIETSNIPTVALGVIPGTTLIDSVRAFQMEVQSPMKTR